MTPDIDGEWVTLHPFVGKCTRVQHGYVPANKHLLQISTFHGDHFLEWKKFPLRPCQGTIGTLNSLTAIIEWQENLWSILTMAFVWSGTKRSRSGRISIQTAVYRCRYQVDINIASFDNSLSPNTIINTSIEKETQQRPDYLELDKKFTSLDSYQLHPPPQFRFPAEGSMDQISSGMPRTNRPRCPARHLLDVRIIPTGHSLSLRLNMSGSNLTPTIKLIESYLCRVFF